ncbi:hypothetical protein [Maridesulfovibrio zosterae]|uniref:hypothetical protein n=1 Tax=Maridesulfovibrio zosterae TaxID=82171 RepID=UPI000425D66A|nr:hypothetical protein [Maridesulfovibrio zosterae]
MLIDGISGFKLNVASPANEENETQKEGQADSENENKAVVIHLSSKDEYVAALRNMLKPAEEKLPSSSHNMLEGSFVNDTPEPSRYITGLMTGYKVQNELMDKFQGVVSKYKLELDLLGEDPTLVGLKAEHEAEQKAKDYTLEEGEESLEETRKEEKQKEEEEAQSKIEEKLMPDGYVDISNPDPSKLSEDIEDKAEEVISVKTNEIESVLGEEIKEKDPITGSDEVSRAAAVGAVSKSENVNTEISQNHEPLPPDLASSSGNKKTPPGTYVDEIV